MTQETLELSFKVGKVARVNEDSTAIDNYDSIQELVIKNISTKQEWEEVKKKVDSLMAGLTT